jgi:molybdopterin-guanine dinucleotide biosynthesis protein A
MGQDKGLMPFNGKPMILNILETLKDLETLKEASNEIILVLRGEKQLKLYLEVLEGWEDKVKLVTDMEKDQGPLVGMLTGLSHLEYEGALILPCDSPYITETFLKRIFTRANNDEFQALVPTWPDGSLEPLHAYYRKECIPVIEKILSKGIRDVKSVLKDLKVDYVDVELLDPGKSSFTNLNSPQDLHRNRV